MKLFFRNSGEGPPLVILHGLYGSSDNWVTISRQLSEKFNVILPDLRNHGQSPHSDIHDYPSMRDDIHELISFLGFRKFFLAGHSMGGKVAAAFALKWPELLKGLLIADISPFTDGNNRIYEYNHHLSILSAILSTDLSVIKSRNEAEKIIGEKISSERITGFILKNLQRNSDGSYSWKLNAPALYNNLKAIMADVKPDNDTILPVTGFPVTILKGSQSNYITTSDFPEIRKIFPASEFKIIHGAGHWVHADKPDEVVTALMDLCSDD